MQRHSPQFIGIGAEHAGLGVIVRLLSAHPGISATIPALNFFNTDAFEQKGTDWYESTRHELEHLYPRLTHGGVLIIDDYGYWEGCRKAVDEYFARKDVSPVFLQRVDHTGRIAVRCNN